MTEQYRAIVPWRTRGVVDPGAGFPTDAGVTVSPGDPIRTNDAFVCTGACAASGMAGCAGAIPENGAGAGDYLVYNGGAIDGWGGWTYVPASGMQSAVNSSTGFQQPVVAVAQSGARL